MTNINENIEVISGKKTLRKVEVDGPGILAWCSDHCEQVLAWIEENNSLLIRGLNPSDSKKICNTLSTLFQGELLA